MYPAYIRGLGTDRSFPINRFQSSVRNEETNMKTSKTRIATMGAAAGIVAVLLTMSGALAPVFAATQSAPSAQGATRHPQNVPTLAMGQNITIESTQGRFRVVGDPSLTGNASGSATFTVTGEFAGGYSLSISSGSLDVNGTTYTVSSGSVEMGHYAHSLVGQGTATSPAANSGAFLVRATARGSFAGEYATMSLDLQNGNTEYAIFLAGTVQG